MNAPKLQITAARSEEIQRVYREYRDVGLSTEPADFEAAQTAITRLYERVGRKRPYFVQLDSPLAAELYIDLYCRAFPIAKKLSKGQLRDQLWGQLWGQLGGQLGGQLRGQSLRYMGTWFSGAWDSYLWAWGDGGRRIGAVYPPALNAALDDHIAVSRSIGWWYPFDEFCVLTGRPDVVALDDRARLHSIAGPALRYRDGYALHAVHGVRVPAWIIERKEKITTTKIDAEANAEIRRVMVELYGQDKYLLDSGAAFAQRDQVGLLYRKELPGDEPIVMVRVLNSTAESDGVMSREEAIEAFGEAARAAIDAPEG
ncbi:MAG: hypothetical protein KGL35_11445, partial [Bradyrhizobium sp.]|nr:hypothetical protein [Bradyrhizobium sp.]